MAKKTTKKTTKKVEKAVPEAKEMSKSQNAIVQSIKKNAETLAALAAGTSIDNISTCLERLSIRLEKRFWAINNAAIAKAERQAKFAASRKKLVARIAEIDKKMN